MDLRIEIVPFQPNMDILGKGIRQNAVADISNCEPLSVLSFLLAVCIQALRWSGTVFLSFLLIPDTSRLSPGKWYVVRAMWAILNHGANRTVGASSLSFSFFPLWGRNLYLFMIKKIKYVSMFLNVKSFYKGKK